MDTSPHCLVVGVGAGTGLACVRKFVEEGYRVSMMTGDGSGPHFLIGDPIRGFFAGAADTQVIEALVAGRFNLLT